MMIAIPKKQTETAEEMKRRLMAEILTYGNEIGIPYHFLSDSKAINEGIEDISNRIGHLVMSIKLDQNLIELAKKTKEEHDKLMERAEKEIEDSRKLRNTLGIGGKPKRVKLGGKTVVVIPPKNPRNEMPKMSKSKNKVHPKK